MTKNQKSLLLFFFLAGLWLLWSGLYKPIILGLGLASCLFVVWLVRHLDTVDEESIPAGLTLGVLPYWGWLLKEIVVSSLQVTRIVLSPSLPISPTLVKVQSKARSQVGRVIFGNSITLTPGTLTTDIDEHGVVSVHALTQEGAEGMAGTDMNDRVARIERHRRAAKGGAA
ncbi:MAG: cation transporter [Betaproteobacteria bacterium]|nr:cation transporter [Betaproteobacteria bacterium]